MAPASWGLRFILTFSAGATCRLLVKDPSFPDTPARIPDDLVLAIHQMLSRDPEDRYPNVTTIIGDLLMLHEEYEETLDDDVARALRESLVPPPLPPSAKTKPAAKKLVANLETEDEDLATTLTMQRSDRSPPQPPKPEPKPVAKKPVAKKPVADKKTTVKQDGKKTVIGIPSPIFPVIW